MRIAIVGYGKMGKEIESIARSRGHSIELIVDQNNIHDLSQENLAPVDVAIEFSTPETAPGNILACLEAGVPVVSGTTGWLNHMAEIKDKCNHQKGAFFYASNFSLGIFYFSRLNEQLAKMMQGREEYRVEMEEIHHLQKKDRPSGTAISLAEELIRNSNRLTHWTNDPVKGKKEDSLTIHSKREGKVPGTHIITWESDFDQIKLIHKAKSRKGFALGAVLAAEFLKGKTGIFGMRDLLKI